MKKLLYLSILCLPLSSCHKLLDYYNVNKPNTPTNCQVTKITNGEAPNDHSVVEVLYHDDGRPESVTTLYTDRDGFEYSIYSPYLYDDANRLIQQGAYSTESPSKTTYAYEGSSRLPVRDTSYQLAHVFVDDLEYDNNGRLIRILHRIIYNPDEGEVEYPDVEYKYYYDVRGNKQEHPSNPNYRGLIEYSDKPSLYSLNPVWQLQYQNYSRNTTTVGKVFNEKGLPVEILDNYTWFNQPFLDMGAGALITYDCK